MASELFDVSEVEQLAKDLANAPTVVANDVRGVVQKGALNVKKDWQSRWAGLSHLPALANSITFDTKVSGLSFEAEVGPDKSRPQGALGNVVEFGTRNNAPQPGGMPALEAEAPKFEKALGDLVEEALE